MLRYLLWLCVFSQAMMEQASEELTDMGKLITGELPVRDEEMGGGAVPEELQRHGELVELLQRIEGRIIGYPTLGESPKPPETPTAFDPNLLTGTMPMPVRVAHQFIERSVNDLEEGRCFFRPRLPTTQEVKNCPMKFIKGCYAHRYVVLNGCCALPCYAIGCFVAYKYFHDVIFSLPFVKT